MNPQSESTKQPEIVGLNPEICKVKLSDSPVRGCLEWNIKHIFDELEWKIKNGIWRFYLWSLRKMGIPISMATST